MKLDDKLKKLNTLLQQAGKVAIAYSGGVDSSFLAAIAFKILGKNCLALTIDSIFIPRDELMEAKAFAEQIGIPHKIITPGLPDDSVLANTPERCYLCKKRIFGALKEYASERGFSILMDGSNIDDLSDYRPGMKAIGELKVQTPLVECEFTKSDIREASKKLGLSTWNRPSLACLASRIPYHTEITESNLRTIEKAEAFLSNLGFKQFRVRHHDNLARIEVAAEERHLLFDEEKMESIARELKDIGYTFVTLDLESYRTGRLNQQLGKP